MIEEVEHDIILLAL